MADARPFNTFNFAVEIALPFSSSVCSAAFADVDGLEMTLEAKTIREGGANGRQIRLAGPVAYGNLTLKRGMTASFDLWTWFDAVLRNARLRADADVVLLAEDGASERMRFTLRNCLPTRIKAPSFSAKDGAIAIEELQLAYEWMTVAGSGGGAGAGLSLGISASASASISVGASLSVSGGVSGSLSGGASIGGSVGASVGASAGASAGISAGASIGGSLGGSAGGSSEIRIG